MMSLHYFLQSQERRELRLVFSSITPFFYEPALTVTTSIDIEGRYRQLALGGYLHEKKKKVNSNAGQARKQPTHTAHHTHNANNLITLVPTTKSITQALRLTMHYFHRHLLDPISINVPSP
jgi:hypothetical protein